MNIQKICYALREGQLRINDGEHIVMRTLGIDLWALADLIEAASRELVCTCSEFYETRKLTDPTCVAHRLCCDTFDALEKLTKEKGERRRVMNIKMDVCPFCGKNPNMEPWHGGPDTKVRISCENDFCQVQPGVCGDTPLEAVEYWNTRS